MFLFAINITVSMSNKETRLRFVLALHQQLMYIHSSDRARLECKPGQRLANVSVDLFIILFPPS